MVSFDAQNFVGLCYVTHFSQCSGACPGTKFLPKIIFIKIMNQQKVFAEHTFKPNYMSQWPTTNFGIAAY